MSEAEKQRRLIYKLNRLKWIRIFAIVLGALLLLTTVSSVLFYNFNKAYYINYVEKSEVDYRVKLKSNEFFSEEWAEEGKAYVTKLIDSVYAGFAYELLMDANNVNFEYAYRVDALLEVKDKSGAVIYDKTDTLVPETTVEKTGNDLVIAQSVAVNYGQYNDLAMRFVDVYDLEGTSSTLSLRMYINVIGACEEFSDSNSDAYVVSLVIPLSAKTVVMSVTSSVEEGDNQILARENETLKNVFMVISIVLGAVSLLGIVLFVIFIYLTRSTDINYEIKINRILQSYKPFIQKINNSFDTEGYQVLFVNTFNEMLEIRDTIQSPILMDENEDRTLTHFLIPTNTKLLYIYEVRIEDYDDIYSEEVAEEVVEEVVEEPVTEVVEETVEEPAVEVVEEIVPETGEPLLHLEDIEFVDTPDEEYVEEPSHPGVEVIGVVWPEKAHRNKIYRYDPDGHTVNRGDIVLVPSRDKHRNRDIVRQAAVAQGNHMVDPDHLKHPLKKIISVVKRVAEEMLMPTDPVAETPVTPVDPVAETPVTPVDPVAETPVTPVDPVAETPAEPVAETPAEPVAETPAEPVAETPAEPVAETLVES